MFFDDFRLVYEENSLCCFNRSMYSGHYSCHCVFRSRKEEKSEITNNWFITYNKSCSHQRHLTRPEISTSAKCLKKKSFLFCHLLLFLFFSKILSQFFFFFSLCLFQSACVFLLSYVCVCVCLAWRFSLFLFVQNDDRSMVLLLYIFSFFFLC